MRHAEVFEVDVPKALWAAWIEEGDLPGDRWSGNEYDFYRKHGAVLLPSGGR